MTEKEALEKSLEMWIWLRDEALEGRIHSKEDWFEKFQKSKAYNSCYLCQFASDINSIGSMCKHCPVESWRERCCILGVFSPYNIWEAGVYNVKRLERKEVIFMVVKGATKMVELLEQNLERFKEDI